MPLHPAFTLVELVLVLTIIGLIAGMAVPRYGQYLARQRVEATARRITADLSYAQRRARFLSKAVEIKFSAAANRYTFLNTPDPDRPASNYAVSLDLVPYEATLVSVDFGGDSDLVFDGYGAPDTGGTVVIRVGAYTKSLVLDAATGEVTTP